ncbi:maltase-glucoamylase [Patella vulgata]|uniref:maltase-glucoamylase n=1 Tax=Patella vulgata TaxID=6465 RepID=UPI00217FDD7B|nr:maltase-glucoamylase [Patella vulgata]
MTRSEFDFDDKKPKKGYCGGKRPCMFAVVLLILAGILAVVIYLAAFYKSPMVDDHSDSTDNPQDSAYLGPRINCFPESENSAIVIDATKCASRGCLFDANAAATGQDVTCFYDNKRFGYKVGETTNTPMGFNVHLSQYGKSPFGGDITNVVMSVENRGDNLLRFKFDSSNSNRFKVPLDLNLPTTIGTSPKYKLEILNQNPFSFTVTRTETNTTIWNTSLAGFTFSDQFLQISTVLPSRNVYGFGENRHTSFRHVFNQTWPMFSRDQPPGWGDNDNLYGVHPFYTCVEDTAGNTHGVLLLNSNAQDYSLNDHPSLTYRTTGGILDFYIFMGPTPEYVIQQYTAVIGRPYMPPYWSLGFQLCRYGYNHIDNITKAVENTKKYNIPLDVQYADIDHMDERKDFTVDDVNFKGLNDYFNTLRNGGMHTIIILDPCLITNETNYEPYERMKEVDGNIKWSNDTTSLPANSSDETGAILGFVWPKGKVVFPDYFKNSTREVWKELIKIHYNTTMQFDGLWVDMNEPANFGTNEEKPWNWPKDARPYWSLKCPTSKWDDPPYRTKAAYKHDNKDRAERISSKTICLSTVQGENGEYRHYDVHSLYGWSQTLPTLEGLRSATGKRGMVISRSTYPGSGRYSGHWLGDNGSGWRDMAESIIGMLEFNLFGIPYIGADICGFWGNVDKELCKRWMQLGAFYTFSRNHNGIRNIPQDPGSLGDDVAHASKVAIETRYWFLPYLYTLFHEAHTQGNTVIRPLHHEFRNDAMALGIDKQFLWGPALLISPILEQGQTTLKYFLPQGIWYNYYDGQPENGPEYRNMAVEPDSPIPLHTRGGHILPLQQPANNTHYSRKNSFKVLVALSDMDTNNGQASGQLFWDDGESIDAYESGNYYLSKFISEEKTLKMKVEYNSVAEISNLYIDSIEVWGVATDVQSVRVFSSSNHQILQHHYDKDKKILKIMNGRLPLSQPFELYWSPVTSDDFTRIDCYPDAQGMFVKVNKTQCDQRNCIFDASSKEGVPMCYFNNSNYGYRKNGDAQETDEGYRIPLQKTSNPGPFGDDLTNITFEVQELDDHLLRIKIYDPSAQRYQVPIKLNLPNARPEEPRYRIVYPNNDTFSFQIVRRSTGAVLWDTGVGGFTFADQFLQIATKLPSENIYGFGENIKKSFRHNLWFKSWPMFSRDENTLGNTQSNHYGVHPFYMCIENDGQSHGVLFLNSNAQDYSFTPLPMLIYKTIGGIFDIFFFLGPEPENVVQQYTTMIGKPYMPPYWSLGFQLSRYGYNSLNAMQEAVNRTRDAGIPHDVQVADIDHMDERKDFTIDDVNYSGLKQYFESLRNDGIRTIIILDPALIVNETNYNPYEKMKAVSGNIKWPSTGVSIPENSSDIDRSVLGYVWPKGKVVFPDFLKNETNRVWSELIAEHYQQIPFDGIWIDMNEPANFGTNEEKPWNWPDDARPYWSLKCPTNKWDDPPYRTGAAFNFDSATSKVRLSQKTICMDLVQGNSEEYKHYDVHSLYGWSQTEATLRGTRLANGNKERGIVLSRSTFPGSGASSVHWLGDNNSSWEQMVLSIVGLLDFNLFGIPFVGADICGFFDDTTPELCKRWMQLGAFYTFSRNHNGEKNIPQDPAVFGDDVTKASKEALETRYWLLPYLYTLFHQAHIQGGTVIRPLHHEFATDSSTYGIDKQFLWGPALLISPILYQSQSGLTYYVPGERWYDFYTGEKVTEGKEWLQMPITPESKIPLHVRAGYILPLQEPANNTRYSRQKPFKVLVALAEIPGRGLQASGQLFWDDGVSIDTYENGNYLSMKFDCKKNILEIRVEYNNLSETDSLVLDTVEIFGVENWIHYVNVNGTDHNIFTNDNQRKTLVINNLGLPLAQNSLIEWREKRAPTQQESERIDCLPDTNKYTDITDKRGECSRRKCIWRPISDVDKVPNCYINNDLYGYSLVSNTTSNNGKDMMFNLKWRNKSQMFTGDIHNITLSVQYINDNFIRFKIYDPNNQRYEVPVPVDLQRSSATSPKYQLEHGNSDTTGFWFRIRRTSTNKILWDTSIGGLTFADQFLQIVTRLPSNNIYGFGENRHFNLRHDLNCQRWPMFSRDQAPGWGDYGNLYGVHPFYMNVEDGDGNAHGVLLLNSNAMEILLQPAPALTYRTIGGVLDFYMFLGPEPESVIQQYTSIIGRPYLPPYWSLGFQLCRYGYNSLKTLEEVVNRTIAADIPYDVQYADIDHMDERKDFTIDQQNFKELPQLFRKYQDMGMKFIIILDPAIISNETNYRPYTLGIDRDVYIKWPNGTNPDYADFNNDNILGYVWPKGKTVFPDFLKDNTTSYWSDLIQEHYMTLPFDGLWIDMNEPANFGTNEERPFNWPEKDKPYWSLKCPTNKWDDPPYKPDGVFGARISEKTICMISLQNDSQYRHYDVHSLYGWSQTLPTLEALQNATNKRGMVISRSTYPSSGKYSGHWLGDNNSQWSHLYDSIIGMIEFNLFGIPYIGADICGFFSESNAELCERWMQVGAFYTYSRNHNGLNNRPQDPAAFGPAVAASSRNVLRIRYSLLPYLYTLFYKVNIQGGTVIRSLLHEFPREEATWSIDTQFMWGSDFMIAPVVLPGKIRRDVYFPSAVWYDYYTGSMIKTRGGMETVSAPRDVIPLYIRGGSILPTQLPANTTSFSRMNPLGLIIAPDSNGQASGSLFWDDGDGIETVQRGEYFTASFNFSQNKLEMSITRNHSIVSPLRFDRIKVLNVMTSPTDIQVSIPPAMTRQSVSGATIHYTSTYKVLKITGLDLPLIDNFTITWS